MPRGDRTGPAGFGPMTGRGLGYCAGFPNPGYMAGGGWFGRGRGRGFGRGRGWAWAGQAVPGLFGPGLGRAFVSREEAREDLESHRDELKRELAGVEEELAQAKTEKK
ncbi:MAG: DUF5320 domain-containing protein [candidate division WOR-3 bacterium]